MADLTEKQRAHIPAKEYGLPAEHKYPMENKEHARNAEARASEEYHKGNLSKSQEEKIDAHAQRVLAGDELIQGKSDQTRSENIATEIRAGKDPKQAAAIAYSVQRENRDSEMGMAVVPNTVTLAQINARNRELWKCASGDPVDE